MQKKEDYFIGVSIVKLVFMMLFFFGMMVMISQVRAEDNKTSDEPARTSGGFPKILDDDNWSSQVLYDTINACYQGTIRWVIMTNPSLIGQTPGPMAQRQMVEHCFCVMDKIRKEIIYDEYIKKVIDPQWGGNIFMLKAVECIREYNTLPSFFMKIPLPDNATKTDNGTVEKLEVLPAEPEGLEESPPDEKPKEQQTILQG